MLNSSIEKASGKLLFQFLSTGRFIFTRALLPVFRLGMILILVLGTPSTKSGQFTWRATTVYAAMPGSKGEKSVRGNLESLFKRGANKMKGLPASPFDERQNTINSLLFLLAVGLAIGVTVWALKLIIAGMLLAGIGILVLELSGAFLYLRWMIERL